MRNIIVMSVIGVVSFAAAFGFGLLTRGKKAAEQPADPQQQAAAGQVQGAGAGTGTAGGNATGQAGGAGTGDTIQMAKNKIRQIERDLETDNPQRSMTEQQLKELIYDIRTRLDDFRQREQRLAAKEQRVATTQEELAKNIKELSDLRVKLAGAVTSLQQERLALEKTVVRIEAIEAENVKKTAAVYDKMKTEQAAEILMKMAERNQMDYAVKILYYMPERTSAKALGEISVSEPTMAAVLSDKLRLIKEE